MKYTGAGGRNRAGRLGLKKTRWQERRAMTDKAGAEVMPQKHKKERVGLHTRFMRVNNSIETESVCPEIRRRWAGKKGDKRVTLR